MVNFSALFVHVGLLSIRVGFSGIEWWPTVRVFFCIFCFTVGCFLKPGLTQIECEGGWSRPGDVALVESGGGLQLVSQDSERAGEGKGEGRSGERANCLTNQPGSVKCH